MGFSYSPVLTVCVYVCLSRVQHAISVFSRVGVKSEEAGTVQTEVQSAPTEHSDVSHTNRHVNDRYRCVCVCVSIFMKTFKVNVCIVQDLSNNHYFCQ